MLVVKYGGSLSGEHGDGHARAEFLPLMFGAGAHAGVPRVQGGVGSGQPHESRQDRRSVPRRRASAPRAAVQTLDAYRPDSPSRRPRATGFARAVGHCVGMGKCRASKGGTMCPSYRATREERYSTRGRARLLGEMLRGELITDGWQSDEVKDALDWCLACKGCRSDCPTHTDMAAYKAEFMSHYYECAPPPAPGVVDGPHRRVGAACRDAARGWSNAVSQPEPGRSAWPVSPPSARCRSSRRRRFARIRGCKARRAGRAVRR